MARTPLRSGLLLAAVVAGFGLGALGVGTPASAADPPCSILDLTSLAKLFGPTGEPATVEVDGTEACRVAAGDYTLTAIDTDGGEGEVDRQRDAHPQGTRQELPDYVNEAFFGWGAGRGLELVARRGDRTVVLRLEGSAAGFSSGNPRGSAPDGDLRGAEVPSSLWALMTEALASDVSGDDDASAAELSGLWRTVDIAPCGGDQLGTRVSRFEQGDGRLRAVKVAGDDCLDDGRADFEGSIGGGRGEGVAFGTIGGTEEPNGSDYRVEVVSPTEVQLSGTAGSLQYTRVYRRLSWPGLDEPSAPEDTSALLGIPGPSEALTTKNVALSAAMSTVLLALVALPTTMFDAALGAGLARLRGSGRRFLVRREPGTAPSAWQTRRAVALYLAAAGFLYSLVQPGWGLNGPTFVTFAGFYVGLAATTGVAVVATRLYVARRYHHDGGRPTYEPVTLVIAGLCVAASRIVGFLPGYMYGVLVGWEPDQPTDEHDRSRTIAIASALTLVVAVAAWLLIPVTDDLAPADPSWWQSLPATTVAGIYVSAVQCVMIGLIPLHLLPGHTLRASHRVLWGVLWASSGFLFVLTLLHPGLVRGTSQSAVGTLVLAALLTGAAVAFWARQRHRDRRPPADGDPWTAPPPSAPEDQAVDIAGSGGPGPA